MDNIISKFKYKKKGILNICKYGIAYQRDIAVSVPYGKKYFDILKNFEYNRKSRKINFGRVWLVGAYCAGENVLDIGAGAGTFINRWAPFEIYGYDINKYSVAWLKSQNKYYNIRKSLDKFTGFTFWDTLEHIAEPQEILKRIPKNAYVFVSIPIFKNFRNITQKKHYRPNEHYYYFTKKGLIFWFKKHNFKLIKYSDYETKKCGRENIGKFVFQR